jgi:hypothetical protein
MLNSSNSTLHGIGKAKNRDDLERSTADLAFDLTPATDNRPFFFNQLPLSRPIQALYIAKGMVGHDANLGGVRSKGRGQSAPGVKLRSNGREKRCKV